MIVLEEVRIFKRRLSFGTDRNIHQRFDRRKGKHEKSSSGEDMLSLINVVRVKD